MNHLLRIVAAIRIGAVICSAAVFVLTAVLYVRSYFVEENFYHLVFVVAAGRNLGFPDYSFRSHQGTLSFQFMSIGTDPASQQPEAWHVDRRRVSSTQPAQAARTGFHFGQRVSTVGSNSNAAVSFHIRYIGVPHWFALLLSALAPAIALWRWQRRNQTPPGCCRNCGYDLRASPQRCPECGSDVEMGSAAR